MACSKRSQTLPCFCDRTLHMALPTENATLADAAPPNQSGAGRPTRWSTCGCRNGSWKFYEKKTRAGPSVVFSGRRGLRSHRNLRENISTRSTSWG